MSHTPGQLGQYERRLADVRVAESLFPTYLQFGIAAELDAADLESLDELDEIQHRAVAKKAAQRALVAAAVFRVQAETHLDAPGYRAEAS